MKRIPCKDSSRNTDEDFLTALEGQKIVSAEVNEDGMHMHLEDGRTVVLVGSFVGYIGVLQKYSIQ